MRYLCFSLIVLCMSGLAFAADWPMFHGPKVDNISPEKGLLQEWPEEGPKLLWKYDALGDEKHAGYSSVTISDGCVYSAGMKNGKDFVFCLDLDGKLIWESDCGDAWTDGGKYPGTRSTPTIDGNRVYYETPRGLLSCLDAKTGKQIWNVSLLEKYGAQNIIWALAESPLVDGNKVIVCPGGPNASVVALDKNTGKEIWAAQPAFWTPPKPEDAEEAPSTVAQKTNYATPMIFEQGGLRILVTMTEKGGIGVNADTGELLFTFPHETKYDINATTPVYTNGTLYVTSGYGTGSELLKVNIDGKKASVEQIWADKRFDNQHGGVVVVDGHAYGTSMAYRGGAWLCQRVSDGEILWEEKANSIGKGSCTYADGLIFGMSESGGKVGIIKATPEGHQLLSQFKLPEEGEGPFWAHPVVCGGRLYLRHGNFLYCYNVGK